MVFISFFLLYVSITVKKRDREEYFLLPGYTDITVKTKNKQIYFSLYEKRIGTGQSRPAMYFRISDTEDNT